MRLYLFGPMRGFPAANEMAFRQAREKLRDMKHEVFCPWEMTEQRKREKLSTALREVMRIDIDWICTYADGIVGLRGWQHSKGSLAEVHVAWAIGIPVYEYDSFSRRVIKEIKVVPSIGA
jgi:nucleoside 2-deoxyribosyltransferase